MQLSSSHSVKKQPWSAAPPQNQHHQQKHRRPKLTCSSSSVDNENISYMTACESRLLMTPVSTPGAQGGSALGVSPRSVRAHPSSSPNSALQRSIVLEDAEFPSRNISMHDSHSDNPMLSQGSLNMRPERSGNHSRNNAPETQENPYRPRRGYSYLPGTISEGKWGHAMRHTIHGMMSHMDMHDDETSEDEEVGLHAWQFISEGAAQRVYRGTNVPPKRSTAYVHRPIAGIRSCSFSGLDTLLARHVASSAAYSQYILQSQTVALTNTQVTNATVSSSVNSVQSVNRPPVPQLTSACSVYAQPDTVPVCSSSRDAMHCDSNDEKSSDSESRSSSSESSATEGSTAEHSTLEGSISVAPNGGDTEAAAWTDSSIVTVHHQQLPAPVTPLGAHVADQVYHPPEFTQQQDSIGGLDSTAANSATGNNSGFDMHATYSTMRAGNSAVWHSEHSTHHTYHSTVASAKRSSRSLSRRTRSRLLLGTGVMRNYVATFADCCGIFAQMKCTQ